MSSERPLRHLWWVGCLGISALGANYALIKSTNQDVAYYVNAVERLLDGARLYRDVIDVNVPTIYGLMALPVWLGRRVGLDSMLAFNLFVFFIAILSTVAAFDATRRSVPNSGILPDILAGVLLVGFIVLPGFHFGQREHLAVMLLSPYALVRARIGPDKPSAEFRAAVGIAAGLGVALKPHFALIAAGLEGTLLFRRGPRGWWPGLEGVLLVLACSSCAAATITLYPEYHQNILPMASAIYDTLQWNRLWKILATSGPQLLIYAALTGWASVLALSLEDRIGDVILVLVGSAVGGIATFVLQAKGWAYHALPVLIFSTTAFAVALAARLRAAILSTPHSPFLPAAVISLAGLACAALTLGLMAHYRGDAALRNYYASTVATARDYARGGPALFISIDLSYTFPGINYAGATYPYRWHHLLPLPALYSEFATGRNGRQFRTPSEMSTLERNFFEAFIKDAVNFPPRVVFINRRPPKYPWAFDLFAYLCQNDRFAELMVGYHWLGRRAHYDVLVPQEGLKKGSSPCTSPPPDLG